MVESSSTRPGPLVFGGYGLGADLQLPIQSPGVDRRRAGRPSSFADCSRHALYRMAPDVATRLKPREVFETLDRAGVHPGAVGALPPQLTALNRSNIAVQELVVKGHLERDREAIYQAVALDPLTAAVCSLDETWQMTDDMFAANERWLPLFA